MFNFKRNRFFPSLFDRKSGIYLNLSLGLFSQYFNKGKFFIKSKQVYLVVAGFLRKVLLFSDIKRLVFLVKGTPIYLQELLTTLNNPVINLYKHPFADHTINENFVKPKFRFLMFLFINNRSYSFSKTRKRGRVKRKISKRVTSINRVID